MSGYRLKWQEMLWLCHIFLSNFLIEVWTGILQKYTRTISPHEWCLKMYYLTFEEVWSYVTVLCSLVLSFFQKLLMILNVWLLFWENLSYQKYYPLAKLSGQAFWALFFNIFHKKFAYSHFLCSLSSVLLHLSCSMTCWFETFSKIMPVWGQINFPSSLPENIHL